MMLYTLLMTSKMEHVISVRSSCMRCSPVSFFPSEDPAGSVVKRVYAPVCRTGSHILASNPDRSCKTLDGADFTPLQ